MVSSLNSNNVDNKLKRLAGKQREWRKEVSPAQKLEYIEQALKVLVSEDVRVKGLNALAEATADMKGVSGKEREYIKAEETMLMGVSLKGFLETLRDVYRVRAGTSDMESVFNDIPMYTVGDQVVADVFPLTPADKASPMQTLKGEVWFEKEHVQDPCQVKPFQFDFYDDKKDGVMVVLGAGNYTMLAVCDCLCALFIKNQVVFLKQHPLRSFLEPFIREVFASLYADGYIDSEPDQGLERASQIVYSPYVTSIHMTGGKATHDAIVWGSTEEEQKKNKASNTPKVKNATVTSELGCVTPFFMTPAEYTPDELEHQAQVLVSAKWVNGSASCNAPQVVIVSENWAQRNAFVSKLIDNWQACQRCCTYYPGVKQRWSAFHNVYPSAKVVCSKECSEQENEDNHLPLLLVEVDVDLSTEAGCLKAKTEYALRNEAFAPVLIVATIKDAGLEDFMKKAVDLGNNYMFGSLSCSLAVPASVDGSPVVEKAIADLHYGSIVTNAWSAQSYLLYALSWGAFTGESLDAVESGIGKVMNAFALPHVEKVVCRTPIIDEQVHSVFTKPFDDIIAADMGLAHFILSN